MIIEESGADNCYSVIEEMKRLGINCGREISRLAKIIHPDCVAIIPLYRSCIVIIQTEEDRENGICSIHAYGDPHWLGRDVNIDTLKSDDFHSEFKINGRRDSPELLFTKEGKTVRLLISNGFDIIELAEKELDKIIGKDLGDKEEKLDIYDN